jgi:DNA-binding GntR family transcriptional regulator
MTAREIADALVADKAPQATRKQAIDLHAAILAALRKRDGAIVVGAGAPARWQLNEAANKLG